MATFRVYPCARAGQQGNVAIKAEDKNYFARRATETRQRAGTAADSAIATAHLRLAAE